MVEFQHILKCLTDSAVDFVVIGGVAAALQGSSMNTLDVDVFAPLDDSNLFKILTALRPLSPKLRMRPDRMPLPDNLDRLRGVKNLYLQTTLGVLDILGEMPGVGTYEEIRSKAVSFDVGGCVCRVLDIDTLIAAKLAAGREKDKQAVNHLRAVRKLRASDSPDLPRQEGPGE